MREESVPPPADGREPFAMPFSAGEVVAEKYEVVRLLGVGCIGFVVLAKRIDLGDEVALKFLRPELAANDDMVARFALEARIAFKIESEHVAQVLDFGNLDDGTPFIVMERLEGKDLGSVLAEAGALPIDLAVEYVLQTCDAVAIAHASGVIHRDIKPENLFLAESHEIGTIKVLDFGVSKLALTGSILAEVEPLTQTATAVGTPLYMSPEQIRAGPDVDGRSDIWALGCVLYELLTGVAAFSSPSIMQICAMILERNPPSLRELDSAIPAELEAIVARCLEKEPRLRFQSVGDLAAALAPFAPERARLWVERCSSAPLPDFARPRPADRQSSVGTSGGLSVSVLPSPPTDVTVSSAEVAAFRPHRRWVRTVIAALAGLALAWLATRGTATLVAPTEERASAPAAGTPAPPLLDEIAEPPATSQAIASSAERPKASASVVAPAVSARRWTPRAIPARPARSVEPEPDVGF